MRRLQKEYKRGSRIVHWKLKRENKSTMDNRRNDRADWKLEKALK